jgi:ABC-type transport system substrate-binding protein
MSNKSLKYIVQGVALALLIYVTASSAVPLLFTNTYAQAPTLFSVTLIAPTGGNVARRQYASIISQNMISIGIDAKLFYVNFDQLVNRMFALTAPPGSGFAEGGYDIGFIGWGFTSYVPDFRSNYDGSNPAYFPPSGNNYAYWNNSQVNSIFKQLYSSTDTATQVQLTHQFEKILYDEAPYLYVYEPIDPVPIASRFKQWGGDFYSEVTFPDIQHWSGGDSLVYAEANPVFPGNTLNPIVSASSNSFYALYIYGEIVGGSGNGGGANLQEPDPRTAGFTPGTAVNITSTPDQLTWTVNVRPHVLFQDGVEVTADDYLFNAYATLDKDTAAVGLGSDIQYLGSKVSFTFLNGTTKIQDNTGPGVPETDGWWKATSRYQFQFHIPEIYAFTRTGLAAFSPLPMHIMEQFPFSTWDSAPFSTASGPYTYHWDTSKYGGSGSYTAVGPVGAGPYKLQSYDFTNNIATLVKFPDYYNATGLEALGQFTINTFKVQWISSKDAAIAALKNGQVDMLDYNYQLQRDVPTLKQLPNLKIIDATELGWQEMGFNMNNPIFGTGTATPLGQSDPSQAATAARDIRKAVSHLIPRDLIVSELAVGAAYPLAVMTGPGWGQWYDPSLKPDSYDLNAAAALLQQAGYTVSVKPPEPIAFSGTPILGSGSVTITGHGPVAEMLVMVQQSTDGGNTWSNVAPALTNNQSDYQVSVPAPPAFGTVWYRANFTGIVPDAPYLQAIFNGSTPLNMGLFQKLQGNSDYWFDGRPLWTPSADQPQLTNPIVVSSASTDAMVVGLVVIIIIAIVGVAVWQSRKKRPANK